MTARGPLAAAFGCEGPRLSASEAAFFREADPWAFILFRRNCETPEQTRALTDALREAVGRAAPVMIDQEGGRVTRLPPPHWRRWRAALADAELPDAERALELRYRLIAADLSAAGIDVNCAPLLDVAAPGMTDALGDRVLGDDPGRVATLGRAVRRGLEAGGVAPVVKHIPGYGRATVDPHEDCPRVRASLDDLARDFAPFRAHADALMGMTAHLIYDAVDPVLPATISPDCIALIRGEAIGFDGLLMSDDVSMGALAGGVGARARDALAAGCDLILHCNADMDEMEAVAANAAPLAGAALRRAAAVDDFDRAAQPFDAKAALAEYLDLTGEIAHA